MLLSEFDGILEPRIFVNRRNTKLQEIRIEEFRKIPKLSAEEIRERIDEYDRTRERSSEKTVRGFQKSEPELLQGDVRGSQQSGYESRQRTPRVGETTEETEREIVFPDSDTSKQSGEAVVKPYRYEKKSKNWFADSKVVDENGKPYGVVFLIKSVFHK